MIDNRAAAGAISATGPDLSSGHGGQVGDRSRDVVAYPASGTEPPLTPRQRTTLRELALGRTYSEAAAVLGIADGTVRKTVWAACARLRDLGFEIGGTIDCLRALGWLRVPPA